MVTKLTRGLTIEEYVQAEIKYITAHKNQLYVQCCALSDEKKDKTTV